MIAQAPETDRRWPITAEQKQQVVQAVFDIAMSDDHRVALAAVRCLLAMEAQNQKDDATDDGQLRAAIHQMARERGIIPIPN